MKRLKEIVQSCNGNLFTPNNEGIRVETLGIWCLLEKRTKVARLANVDNSGSRNGTECQLTRLPLPVALSELLQISEHRFNRFKGHEFTTVTSSAQTFSKLPVISANIEHHVHLPINEKIR